MDYEKEAMAKYAGEQSAEIVMLRGQIEGKQKVIEQLEQQLSNQMQPEFWEQTPAYKNGYKNGKSIPQGYKLVPIEPTKAMLDASYSYIPETGILRKKMRQAIAEDYKAMIAAAPDINQ